jgi:hypothetical protein
MYLGGYASALEAMSEEQLSALAKDIERSVEKKEKMNVESIVGLINEHIHLADPNLTYLTRSDAYGFYRQFFFLEPFLRTHGYYN